SFNSEKSIGEWDEITDAMSINVSKNKKIRVIGEKGMDITTSDWHPFFVKQKTKFNNMCPICKEKIKNLKSFATHLKNSGNCREKYNDFPKYEIVEKRADELNKNDYVLQNSDNLFSDGSALSKEIMWLAGFFIGDGCISKFIDNRGGNSLEKNRIRFFSSNRKALEKIKNILSKYFNAEVNVLQNDKRSEVLLEISSSKKEVLDFFFKIGFKPGKKVYDVSISPFIKKNINKHNVFSLLSGLMDSDGHISKRDGDFEYSTVSEKLAEDVFELCNVAGISISKSLKKTKRKNEKDIYRLRIPQYEMTRIREMVEAEVNFNRIKHVILNREKRHFSVVRVKSASKVNVEDNEFYDLTTKNNHNYLAGKNCLVFVHNTVFHTYVGERLSKEAVKKIVKKISDNYHLPYFTMTPTFSICPIHGYLPGEHEYCPKCDEEFSEKVLNTNKTEEVSKDFSYGEDTSLIQKFQLNYGGEINGTDKM
ncbi:MAG: anaerobic ribonucleoside-triphosphate reductase, partial [Nanoarchaeota archaeon]|nr:anaerobic ribonucleoside-triphosphate reductase [Nanoarchaeota archaeon]